MTVLKSKQELEAKMLNEARRSGKCHSLTGIVVYPSGHESDWDFSSQWNGPAVPEACRLELIEIKIRMKKDGLMLK